MKKSSKKINCKICKNYLFNKFVVKLKNAPESAQNFSLKKKQTKSRIELNVSQCSGCGLIQITNKPVGYYKKVIRAVGISKPMLNFRKKQFSEFCKKFKLKNKTIIEIGCGTGDYLNVMKKIIKKSHGLESSNKNYKECKKRKLKVFKGFIHNKNYKISKIKYDAFYILSFLEHIPKINEFLRGIYFNLKENAVGIIEVPNFNMILEKKLYTEFIIDHLYYFTKDTLKLTLEYNGFEVIRTKEIWHKYIISAIVRKKKQLEIKDLPSTIEKIQSELSNFIKKFPKNKIAIWGAGHQALTLITLSKIEKKIKYIVDSASFKQNKFAPGSNLKIVSPNEFRKDNMKAVVIMAAGFSDEVCKTIKSFDNKIKIAILKNNQLEKIH